MAINTKKLAKNFDSKIQQDPFSRSLICYLIRETNGVGQGAGGVADKFINSLKIDHDHVGFVTSIDHFLEQVDLQNAVKISEDYLVGLQQEIRRAIINSIKAVISRVVYLLEENDPEAKDLIKDTNNETNKILNKIPVNIKWQLSRILGDISLCDHYFEVPLKTGLKDDSRILPMQFDHSRWKEIEQESLFIEMMKQNLPELIANTHGEVAENFIKDQLDEFVKKEAEEIQTKILEFQKIKLLKNRSDLFPQEIQELNDRLKSLNFPLGKLHKELYQYILAIFYSLVLSPKKLFALTLLERYLDARFLEMQQQGEFDNFDLCVLNKPKTYIDELRQMWKTYNKNNQ